MDMKTVAKKKEQSGILQDFHAWERKMNMMENQRQILGFQDNNWCSFMLGWWLNVRNRCEAERKKDWVSRQEDLERFGQKF